ncbi:MAG: hypothetical protein L0Y56_19555, partial [Nitrospira sp.]|nr:hypothetical protein [Nitrospira sp.]
MTDSQSRNEGGLMKKVSLSCLFVILLVTISVQAQDPATSQGPEPGQNVAAVQPSPLPTALLAYTKWRDESLR